MDFQENGEVALTFYEVFWKETFLNDQEHLLNQQKLSVESTFGWTSGTPFSKYISLDFEDECPES